MPPILITVASVGIGAALAGVTFVSLINAQTAPPETSPGNVSQVDIAYGTTN